MPDRAKVLVYLFGSLGDTIVALPALRAVRRQFSNAEIVLLQNVQSGDLVKVSEVIPGDLVDRYLTYSNELTGPAKLRGFYRLWREVRNENFAAVVYLVISERPAKSVARDKRFFRSCGIRRLIGFHPFSKNELYPVDRSGHPATTDHEARRKLTRLAADGINVKPDADLHPPFLTFSDAEMRKIHDWLDSRRKDASSRLIAIAPGCKTMANQWPIANFVSVGDTLLNNGCEIVIVGGPAEFGAGEKMIEAWNGGINAAGAFSVRESAALLSLCDLYIGLDTGTTHLAAAVGTRCLAIYGERNNPGHWFPLGPDHVIISHRVDCAGCRLFTCPIPSHPCMSEITVDSVLEKLGLLLAADKKTGSSQLAEAYVA